MAQEAALEGVANSKVRRLLAHNKSSNCANVKIGDSVLSLKAVCRESAPQYLRPARVSAIDETGLAVELQSQTFKVARFCAREEVQAQDVEAVE